MPPTQAGGTQEAPPGLPWADEWRGLGDRSSRGHKAAPPRKRERDRGRGGPREQVGSGSESAGLRGVREVPGGRLALLDAPHLGLELAVGGGGRAREQEAGGRQPHPASGDSPSSRRLPGLGAAAAGSEARLARGRRGAQGSGGPAPLSCAPCSSRGSLRAGPPRAQRRRPLRPPLVSPAQRRSGSPTPDPPAQPSRDHRLPGEPARRET